MILNAPLFPNHISFFPLYSDCSAELSYETCNPWFSTNSTPSPSLSKSSSPKSTVSQVKERRVFDLPCAICLYPATGYHYNVASCNGCKTFFRRCVLSGSSFRCIRSDANCLSNMRLVPEFAEQKLCTKLFSPIVLILITVFTEHPIIYFFVGGARIKCRSCRLDRCLSQGMRKEAVTSGLLSTDAKNHAADAYLAAISEPSTSSAIPKVNHTASILRQAFRLITKFRKCDIRLENVKPRVQTLLRGDSFLDKLSNYQEIVSFKRDLPEWLTMDLLCSIEFVKRFPDLTKFSDSDKEELVRNSCFTIAIAIQAIESYFEKQVTVVMPDGTEIVQQIASVDTRIESAYKQMFINIMHPLYRESFTIDELVLTLQLLFYSIATPDNLSTEGKAQLELSIKSSMQCLMVLLITENKTTFSSRYGALMALNETFIKVSHLHKQKMREGDSHREKFCDLLVEECVFDYRPTD
ncbi:CBN-NHR-137 protein [Caenorhabditis brenneri]|uniref:CBN-NHR-137 protein n=1 Tax=Caenorhabditis brenneri TaxID=135651 RepID=G0MSJ6_CAEBE|nr:CBN-NHR-137 protein [Caenorhabditis brenneri]